MTSRIYVLHEGLTKNSFVYLLCQGSTNTFAHLRVLSKTRTKKKGHVVSCPLLPLSSRTPRPYTPHAHLVPSFGRKIRFPVSLADLPKLVSSLP